jgi:hypothetical protein
MPILDASNLRNIGEKRRQRDRNPSRFRWVREHALHHSSLLTSCYNPMPSFNRRSNSGLPRPRLSLRRNCWKKKTSKAKYKSSMNMINKYYAEHLHRPFYTPGTPFTEVDARDFVGMLIHEWQTDEKGRLPCCCQLVRLVTLFPLSLQAFRPSKDA